MLPSKQAAMNFAMGAAILIGTAYLASRLVPGVWAFAIQPRGPWLPMNPMALLVPPSGLAMSANGAGARTVSTSGQDPDAQFM